jgi:cyclopropane fatty-acyl-phospholipid synthase-like methyltransferase
VGAQLARSVANSTRAGMHFLRRHTRYRDRKAIEYHYDVSNDFYALFLDPKMVYSCAYYHNESDSLAQAQTQKLDYILTKLLVQPGERFPDIGCGWGVLIVHAAKANGAMVEGITLSKNQFDYVRDLVCREGLENRCTVSRCDYRDLPEAARFDKIASVGMFEHVGLCHEWASRLERQQHGADAIVGDKRFRIWQVYLAGCAYGFVQEWMNVYQVLVRKADNCARNPLPLTRDYMYSSDKSPRT